MTRSRAPHRLKMALPARFEQATCGLGIRGEPSRRDYRGPFGLIDQHRILSDRALKPFLGSVDRILPTITPR
jgi:hypothetical protein